MSQYLTVFAITQNNDCVIVGEWSRSTKVFTLFSDFAPYGKTEQVDIELLQSLQCCVQEKIKEIQKDIRRLQKKINFLAEMVGATIDEKMGYYYDNVRDIDSQKEEINEWNYAYNYLCFLTNLIEDNRYGDIPIKLVAGIDCPIPNNDVNKENQ